MKSRIFDNDAAKILTFNQGVRGSNPRWFTKNGRKPFGFLPFFACFHRGFEPGGSGRKENVPAARF